MVCSSIDVFLFSLFAPITRRTPALPHLIFFLLLSINLSAQTAPSLPLELLTINNGLSQGFISGIVQDKKGFMWFTTSDGLNKYDGYTFIVYHHDPDDPASIGSDDLSCVYEDKQGRLWLGTRHHGIDLFDREKNVFIHFRHGSANSLRSDNIIEIMEDKTGHLWVRTEQGIDRMEINGDPAVPTGGERAGYPLLFTPINLDTTTEPARYGPESPRVFIDSRNRIYVTTNSRIWEVLFDRGKRSYQTIQRFHYAVVDSAQIANLIEDTVNHCLLLNYREVVKFPAYDFDAAVPLYKYLPAQTPWAIDKQHRLWLPDSHRIVQLQVHSGRWNAAAIAEPLLRQAIKAATILYTDRAGVIWIGTGGYGIMKYNPEKENFHHILPEFIAYQIFENAPNELLTIGLNGYYAISLKNRRPAVITQLIDTALLHKASLKIMFGSFAKDSAGDYWFGMPAQIVRYRPETKTFYRLNMPRTEKSNLPFPLYADKKDNLWIGYNKYFIRYAISSGTFTLYEYPVKLKSYDFDFLQCIYEDKDLLWLGSVNGLFRFNTSTGHMENYVYHPSDTNSLSNNFILSLYNDRWQPDRYLWVGTKGGGLNRMNKATGRFERYAAKNGLPNNVVYGILTDRNGNLWLSTNKGLSEFNIATQHFRNFDVSDGLQSNEFNRFAYCSTGDSLLVFGGMNGINYFDPADIRPLEPPEVVMTDFRLFNKTVDFKIADAPINKEISFMDRITLRYEQNVITFQFAAMDFRKAGNARYRYMMESFDRDWIYSGTIREATYTNLDPGTYRFVVEASLADGVWSKKQTSIQVIVIPPWWRTWWFYTLAVSGTLSVTYALYRYRLNQLLRLERVRNRIARDLHDEVGSSISTIAIYSKIIHEQLGSSSFNNEPLLNKISENAQEIMEAMNDIVWNINTKNDVFELIISRMREHAYQLFEAKGYTLHFNFDEDLARMKLGMEKRRDFYLIYKEALNNIAKYANGKNVWITLAVSGTTINLTIKDDGKGFDLKTVRKSSNGLTNMSHRTAALHGRIKITSAPGEGTEIRLSF